MKVTIFSSNQPRHLNLANSTSDPAHNIPINGLTWGQRSDNQPYYMIYPYYYNNGYSSHTRLRLNWHTGIEIGAHTHYGGVRFFADSVIGTSRPTELFSIV